jgi:hypothetical protein
MKVILPIILIFLLTSFRIQENNVDGLKIKFRKVANVYSMPSGPGGIQMFPSEGMTFKMLKLILSNDGTKDCTFNFNDVYISTKKDSLYSFSFFYGFSNPETKIKPQKEIDRIVYFEFPEDENPKELFIEDKRYKIKVE